MTHGSVCTGGFALIALAASSLSAAELTGVWPEQDQFLNTGDVEIILYFSAPIDPSTATADSIRLYRLGELEPDPWIDDTPVAVSAIVPEEGDTRLRVIPSGPLADGDYAVVVYGSASAHSGPGYGLYFNNNVAQYDLDPFRTLGDTFTLEVWTRLDDWSGYGSHTFGAWFDVGQSGRYVPGFWLSHDAADVLFGFRLPDGTETRLRAEDALAKGEWRHLAAVSSPEGVKIYVNGELAAGMADTFRPDSIASYMDTVILGYSRWAGAYDYLLGMVDELRVWNIARTQAEIKATMFTPLAGDEPGLIIYHPLDEGAGETMVDATAHGHDGVKDGASWQTSDAPIIEMATAYLTSADGRAVDVDGDGWPGGVLVSQFHIDVTGPRVTGIQPDLTAGRLMRRFSTITLQFDDTLNASTVNVESVSLLASGMDGGFEEGNEIAVIPSGVTYDDVNRTVTVQLAAPLSADTYRFTFLDTGTNLVGLALDGELPGLGGEAEPLPSGDGVAGGNFAIDFEVAPPPQVISMAPGPGVLCNAASNVKVEFSQPIDPATVTSETFRVIGDGDDDQLGTADDVPITAQTITISPDGLSATLTPETPFLMSETYHVLLLGNDSVTTSFSSETALGEWKLNGTAFWSEAGEEVAFGTTSYYHKLPGFGCPSVE